MKSAKAIIPFFLLLSFIPFGSYSQSLPGLDTMIVDVNDSVFRSIPIDYRPIDTITLNSDSSYHRHSQYFDNGDTRSSEYWTNRNFSKYYILIDISCPPNHTSGSISIDTNDVSFISGFILRADSSYGLRADTLILDSSSKINILTYSDKNDWNYIETRIFHRITKIIIDRPIGLRSNHLEKTAISLYPNPSRDELLLKTDEGVNGLEYVVYNYGGQTVLSGTLYQNRLDIEQLTEGAYIIQIPELNFSERFIKQ